MNVELTIERLFQSLITGDRNSARSIVDECHQQVSAEELTDEVLWPVLEMVNSLFRADQLTTLAHHYAVRLLRSLVDQAQANYQQKRRNGRKILMFCGTSEADELAGQLAANVIEANGYEVYFGGGGVANDEILGEIGEQRPDILLMFASSPGDAPNIRMLIDTIRSVDACPNLQIAVGGGVFNRAEGLAEEIGADLWAKSPREMVSVLDTCKDQRATSEQRTGGRNRRTFRNAA
ncbi:MAG TPA: B12-binding domain-containing protein [Phycisphaerales bacterium]|nr:B12-binding domain-containing protein [Phycisphaerales bacterium]